MKLNPPASSSDLDVARQIARRLHQSRRRDDPAAAGWSSEEAPVRPRLTPPPLPARPSPPEVFEDEPPARAAVSYAAHESHARPERHVQPERPPERHVEAERRAEPRPAPPPPRRPEPEPDEPVGIAEEEDVPEPAFEPAESKPFERPGWSEPPSDDPSDIEALAPEPAPLEDLAPPPEPYGAEEPEPPMPDVDVDEPALSPEEMVGEAAVEVDEEEAPADDSSPLDALTDPGGEGSPFDDAALELPQEPDEPAPPSWDDIVESCRGLAGAGGAMLIDPAGQVFASSGSWPAPGPEQIASKLVAMMAKTLKDAPTRSISAPLMGKHLTAWRVPISEGLVTAAFIGPAPVRADTRPSIDQEILSGVRS